MCVCERESVCVCWKEVGESEEMRFAGSGTARQENHAAPMQYSQEFVRSARMRGPAARVSYIPRSIVRISCRCVCLLFPVCPAQDECHRNWGVLAALSGRVLALWAPCLRPVSVEDWDDQLDVRGYLPATVTHVRARTHTRTHTYTHKQP